MKEKILEYIVREYGSFSKDRTKHYSYCPFPGGECTCKDLKKINCDTSLISGGYMDSFEMVSVLVFIETAFHVQIPDNEAVPSNFDSVNKIAELVNKHLQK